MELNAHLRLGVKQRRSVMVTLVVLGRKVLAAYKSPAEESVFRRLELVSSDEDVEIAHGSQARQVIEVTDTPGTFEQERLDPRLAESFHRTIQALL